MTVMAFGNSGRLSDGVSNLALALPRVAGLDASVFLAASTENPGEEILGLNDHCHSQSAPGGSEWGTPFNDLHNEGARLRLQVHLLRIPCR